MNTGLIALIVLFLVMALGFWRKTNIGLLAIAAATILGYASKEFTAKQIIGGFSGSLFMTLLGVMLFFGIVNSNGCLEVIMKKLVSFFQKSIWMIPILIYLAGWTMAAIGPGCIPALAFIATISIPIAHQTGFNPIMLMLIGDVASYSGRFTAITPEGVLVTKLMAEQGYNDLLTPMVLNTGMGTIILSVIFYFAYKGHHVRKPNEVHGNLVAEKLSQKQIFTLLGILLMVIGVVFFKLEVGLTSFTIAVILILLGVVDDKKAFSNVPWNTLILVTGVGVLMNLVIGTGGIELLANTMAQIMTPETAPGVVAATAGVMSWFSSTMGVVLPTLLPTVGTIVEKVGGNVSVVEIVSVIGITASSAGFSPASSVGAIILAAHDSDEIFRSKKDARKLFLELFAWSVFCVVLLTALTLFGLFGVFK